jgi:hypothetical protein
MGIPAFNYDKSLREDRVPSEIAFEEHPSRAFRGLMMTIGFEVLLCASVAAAWLIWHFARS